MEGTEDSDLYTDNHFSLTLK